MSIVQEGRLTRTIVLALCLGLVLFPKGGMRIGGLPLTWGYLFLGLTFIVLIPYRMLYLRARYVTRQAAVILCLVPFLMLFLYTFLKFGVNESKGGFVSQVISLIFLPMLFLWFFPPMLFKVNGPRMMKLVCFCVLGAALFGLFLFVWKPVTGSFLQIPYVTVNADDDPDFTATKNIARGFLTKLISTYNNGNLYGAATLIVLHLFDCFSPQRWKRWTVRLALVLTLSRTIWAGLIFDQLLGLGATLVEQRRTFPRLRLGRAGSSILVIILLVPLFLFVLELIGANSSFLFDPTLGGRTAQFTTLGEEGWLPSHPSTFMFNEIVYLSSISLYGRLGLPTITLVLLSPLIILTFDRGALRDPIRRAALRGLLLYAMICTSDGAFNFIPVMAFYWFTYMIFLFGVPGMGGVYPISLPRFGKPSPPTHPMLLEESPL